MSIFYAFVSRMRYIDRWSLMKNNRKENVMEHAAMVAMFAHCLAVIHNKFGGNVNPERVGMMGLFHETGEVITGDMPTPIKYFNPEITSAYKQIEKESEEKFIKTLPKEVKQEVGDLITGGSEEEQKLVKCADTLAAYVKCIEESAGGSGEFKEAERATLKKLKKYESKEVSYFLDHFVSAYGLSLDKLSSEIM
ncbi:MAG: 5'-deoxynucleotidase [Clostridia bacterium]|nr:5'-deoxynucleotidase [Clostridia bacterium]